MRRSTRRVDERTGLPHGRGCGAAGEGNREAMAAATERHWVLVGLMGVGKTTIGRALAARHGRPFVDSDEQLRRATGETAREIVRQRGVDALHALEVAALRAALRDPVPSVIAAAAAVADADDVTGDLRDRAVVVWLDAPASVAAARAATGTHRPRADEATLRAQEARRSARYAALADVTVDAAAPPGPIVDRIEAAMAARDAPRG